MKKTANSNELYFITFTVVHWLDVFTRIEYKNIVVDILNYYIDNNKVEIYSYVIMSNHIHLIARSAEDSTLSKFIREFKSYSSKKLFDSILSNPRESRKENLISQFKSEGLINNKNISFQIWQNGNHPLKLYTKKMIAQKINYINENPVRAGWVNESWKYWFSSANPEDPVKCIR
jgi:REP element-mobilizing transposase RayT